jgi:signal transduction histidine kinase
MAQSEQGGQAAAILTQGSIASRLLASVAVFSLAVLAVAGWSLQALYRSETGQRLDVENDATLLTLASAVSTDAAGELVFLEGLLPNDERFGRAYSGRYWAFVSLSEEGRPERSDRSRSFFDAEPALTDADIALATAGMGAAVRFDAGGPDDSFLRVGIQAIRLPNRTTPVLLYAALDRTAADEAVSNFAIRLGGALALLAVALAAGALAAIRYGLRPLRDIQAKLHDVRTGRRERLDGVYPRELAPLVAEIDTLVVHNRRVVERARTQVGNLAHALKTPLAVLMNETRAEDRLADLVRRQADAMSASVQHYLKRARAAALAEGLAARSDTREAVEDIARMLERLHRSKDIAITVDVGPDCVFRGERGDLDELVGNLLENAAKWCKSRVRVSVRREADTLRIVVEDDGPGLAPEDRRRALKRGGRVDESEPGTGLGLAIVTELADIYGGRLDLGDSVLGGLRAGLSLPAAPR